MTTTSVHPTVSPPNPARRVPPTAAVPVGRRFLFADRRRATLTVLGVAASLLLVLVLGGIFAGAVDRVTYYIRTSPADVFVSQAGVRTMHMSASTLPADAPDRVAQVPGVAWAAPIAFASGSVAGPQGRQLTYLIGYDTQTGRGGPSALTAGRLPGASEAIIATTSRHIDREPASSHTVELIVAMAPVVSAATSADFSPGTRSQGRLASTMPINNRQRPLRRGNGLRCVSCELGSARPLRSTCTARRALACVRTPLRAGSESTAVRRSGSASTSR